MLLDPEWNFKDSTADELEHGPAPAGKVAQ